MIYLAIFVFFFFLQLSIRFVTIIELDIIKIFKSYVNEIKYSIEILVIGTKYYLFLTDFNGLSGEKKVRL